MLAIPLFSFPRRTYISAAVAMVAMIVSGAFVLRVQAQSVYHVSGVMGQRAQDALSDSFFGTPVRAIASQVVSPMQEVHIANNGLMLLRGARVVSISGSVLRVAMGWRGSDYSWTVHIDSRTKFYSEDGTSAKRENIRVGDMLSISGMLLENWQGTGVQAEYIRK